MSRFILFRSSRPTPPLTVIVEPVTLIVFPVPAKELPFARACSVYGGPAVELYLVHRAEGQTHHLSVDYAEFEVSDHFYGDFDFFAVSVRCYANAC